MYYISIIIIIIMNNCYYYHHLLAATLYLVAGAWQPLRDRLWQPARPDGGRVQPLPQQRQEAGRRPHRVCPRPVGDNSADGEPGGRPLAAPGRGGRDTGTALPSTCGIMKKWMPTYNFPIKLLYFSNISRFMYQQVYIYIFL